MNPQQPDTLPEITVTGGGKLHMQRLKTVKQKALDEFNAGPRRLTSTDTMLGKLGDGEDDVPRQESSEEDEKEENKHERPELKRSTTYESEFVKNFGRDGYGRIAILLFGRLYPKSELE